MVNNVKSLQELYVTLGGELTDTYEDIADGVPVSDITTISEMVQAVGKKAGKKELPEVSAIDDGKVLKVDNGKWVAGEAGGEGEGPLRVVIDIADSNLPKNFGGSVILNASSYSVPLSEIKEAVDSGRMVYFVLGNKANMDNSTIITSLPMYKAKYTLGTTEITDYSAAAICGSSTTQANGNAVYAIRFNHRTDSTSMNLSISLIGKHPTE